MKKLNKKGFTLAELLIVVAIIAVLVAISVPVFGAQLNKAKFMADVASVRAAYAEEVTTAMVNNSYTTTGMLQVAQANIVNAASTTNHGNGSTVVCADGTGTAGAQGTITVTAFYDNTVTQIIYVDADVDFT